MTAGELQTHCRKRRLRRWSKLRRDDLLAFVKQELGPELKTMQILQQEQTETAPGSHFDGSSPPADASRTEHLLLLVLRHLDIAADEVEAAWRGPHEQA